MTTVRCPRCLKTWESPVVYATFFGRSYEVCSDCWKARYEEKDSFLRAFESNVKNADKSPSREF